MIPMMLLIPVLIGGCCLLYTTRRKKFWSCFRRRKNTVTYTQRIPLQVSGIINRAWTVTKKILYASIFLKYYFLGNFYQIFDFSRFAKNLKNLANCSFFKCFSISNFQKLSQKKLASLLTSKIRWKSPVVYRLQDKHKKIQKIEAYKHRDFTRS